MKFKTFIVTALVVALSLVVTPVVSAQASVAGTSDDTAGVFLYSAGLSAGTAENPTGQPAGAPTDDIVSTAISFDLLEFVGDVPEEVDSFTSGVPEPAGADADTTEAEVVEGLTTVDDFGYLTEGGDDAANFDAGRGGSFVGGLRAIPGVRDALVIVPDGVDATGTLGPSGGVNATEAAAALDGCEIFIFEDAELSGMEITLSSPTNNIVIEIDDRQVDPHSAGGTDDSLIAIDLDTLDGFDGTYIDTISIADDGVVMATPPRLWGDTSLEIDAIATRSSASVPEGYTPGFWRMVRRLFHWLSTGYDWTRDLFNEVFRGGRPR